MSDPPEEKAVGSLYDLSLHALIKLLNGSAEKLRVPVSLLETLTPAMKCDLLIELARGSCKLWSKLANELLSSPRILLPALSVKSKCDDLRRLFQTYFWDAFELWSALAKSVVLELRSDAATSEQLFPHVLSLVRIMMDMACLNVAEDVLRAALACSVGAEDDEVVGARLMLLHTLTAQVKLGEAEKLAEELGGLSILSDDGIGDIRIMQLRATYNMECCRLHLEKSNDFRLAYSKAMAAVNCLREEHPVRLVIDVYRIASRAAVMKRKFDIANVFVREAVRLARAKLGPFHFQYGMARVDLGFYLALKNEPSHSAWTVFKDALTIIERSHCDMYLGARIRELQAEADLGEYTNQTIAHQTREIVDDKRSSPTFESEEKPEVLSKLKPIRLPLSTNAIRLNAILWFCKYFHDVCKEKLRLFWRRGQQMDVKKLQDFRDPRVKVVEDRLLTSLEAAEKTFGERSLPVARHLDSLGFFYWKTLRFCPAESTLERALSVKRTLLGPDDREVAATLRQLGVVHFLQKKFDLAAPLLIRCANIMRMANSERLVIEDCLLLIALYRKTGNVEAQRCWSAVLGKHMRPILNMYRRSESYYESLRWFNEFGQPLKSLADVVEELTSKGAFS